jgi:hypothetical protein
MVSVHRVIPALVAACVMAGAEQTSAQQQINLAQALDQGKLRSASRGVTKLPERNGIRLEAKEGDGAIAWVLGTDFKAGTIEVDVRGKDVLQQSFVGLAFHGKDDKTYEAVYLRPFNFRAEDPVRRDHAVQYISMPEFGWARLRKEFPEEFENPVDQSLGPNDWVRLRIVVEGAKVRIYAGQVGTPALEVRKLGQLDGGMIGLRAGNNSEADFANLTITPAK